MIVVPLTQGFVTMVDDQDEDLVSPFTWHLFPNFQRGFYAVTNRKLSNGRFTTLRMHRLILNAEPDQIVDHANRNGLDNRRRNLRFGNRSLNAANSKHRVDRRSSPYRGVYKYRDIYKAEIRVNTRLIRLGNFVDPIEAAIAYDVAALGHFGEFAQCNFR